MFQRFNQDTIVSKFIKAFLSANYIPTIPIYSTDNKDILDNLYIIKDQIFYKDDSNIIKRSSINTLVKNNGINTNYLSNSYGYDSITHKYLGDYLRYYKEISGIDLLPFYNCYSNIYLKDIYLDKEQKIKSAKSIYQYDTDYKYVAIPIKFNRPYTIAIDAVDYKIFPIIYGNKGILDLSFNDSIIVKDISYSSFKQPYLYRIDNTDKNTSYYESCLYLVLRIPITNRSSIVVLEGDYTQLLNRQIYSMNADLSNTNSSNDDLKNVIELKNSYFQQKVSLLSLLTISDGYCYAFSDRLIEYLLKNVIDSEDNIENNVKRVIQYCESTRITKNNNIDRFNSDGKYYWTSELQDYLYKLMTSSNVLHCDITGFVDKDVESEITKGQDI